jgi:hypothetical protein
MTKQKSSVAPASELHGDTVDALYAYMSDCQFTESDVNAMNIALALEYVYRPDTRFWREFRISYVVDAISRLHPSWRNTDADLANQSSSLFTDIADVVYVNAFDEANAERLLRLPALQRPSEAWAAFEWIAAELKNQNLHVELAFAERDGARCGKGALAILECIEQAKLGKPVFRIGASVARTYRDAVMKQQAEAALS